MVIDDNLDMWANRFPFSLVPQAIQLVLDSWKTFRTTQTNEVKITQEFCPILNRNQKLTELPFIVDPEITLLNERGTDQIGRLDLRIIHGHIREAYFSFECKRLRWKFPGGRFDSLADAYVTDGMYRYFNGQYATGLDKGGMLGYVMDGKCDEAVNDVQKAVEKRRSNLYMQGSETLKASSAIASNQVKETHHKYGPDGNFIVYHIFLPMA
ncbi:MAG: hypothetical protein JW709_07075 [Sedimentisphaerales bacterium]|nr:hypothetical protein [Sedimentisphaerales bacterium]